MGSRTESPAEYKCGATTLMLLTNAYDPDPRVRQEALTLLEMGCRVRLLAWDRDLKRPATENMEDVEVERVFLSSSHGRGITQIFFYVGLYLRLLWRGLCMNFDIVHCHDLDTLPIGFVLGKLKRKPIVYDAHESFPDMLTGSVSPVVRRWLVWLENILIRRTDLLITVGEKLRRHFAERGAPHSVVVGNWKRTDEFSQTEQQKTAIRRRLGIPDSAMVVVCITQLLKDRQIPELLEAVDGCPDVYAIIGGKGVLEPFVKEWAAKNPRIIYVGFVRGNDISAYTCASDVVYYGFDPDNPNARFSAPNKLFEALAAGKPLITGDFGEIADVVRRFTCGIVLVQYSSEQIRNAFAILRDARIRKAMGAASWQAGQTSMNWDCAEAVLYREYSTLFPRVLKVPESLRVRGAKERPTVAGA